VSLRIGREADTTPLDSGPDSDAFTPTPAAAAYAAVTGKGLAEDDGYPSVGDVFDTAHGSTGAGGALAAGGEVRLSRRTAACYSVGHFLNDATASAWFSYLLLYLQDARGLNSLESGLVLFAGQIFDAVATPTVGLLSDASQGFPRLGLGRRKLWNLIGLAIVVVCFGSLFGAWDFGFARLSSAGRTGFYATMASLFNCGWAAVQVSHMAMVPELSTRDSERVMLNSARYFFTVMANVFVFVSMFLILRYHKGSDPQRDNKTDPVSYMYLAWCIIGFGGLLSTVFLVGTKEPLPAEQGAAESKALAPGAAPVGQQRHASAVVAAEEDEQEEEEEGEGHRLLSGSSATTAYEAPVMTPQENAALLPGTASALTDAREESLAVSVNRRGLDGLGQAAPGSSEGPRREQLGSSARPTVMRWKDWIYLKEAWQVALAYMFARLAVNVSQVYMSFYVTDVLNMSSTAIAIVPLLLYVSQLGATIGMKQISSHFGRRHSMTLGGGLFVAACITMLFISSHFSWVMYPTVVVLGLGSAITMVISVSLEADLVGDNVESGAFVYGAISLTDKLSNGMVILAIQIFGNSVTDQTQRSHHIRWINGLVPLAAMVFAVLVSWTIRIPRHLQGKMSKAKKAKVRDGEAVRSGNGNVSSSSNIVRIAANDDEDSQPLLDD
jgi:Na+/melibiose symporter-like transporter